MGERRESAIERVLHRVEDHVERWRRDRQSRLGEVEAERDRFFEEAAERERRLAGAVEEAAAGRDAEQDAELGRRAVFVVHSREAGQKLRDLAEEGASLAKVVPGKTDGVGGTELEGSWLIMKGTEQHG